MAEIPVLSMDFKILKLSVYLTFNESEFNMVGALKTGRVPCMLDKESIKLDKKQRLQRNSFQYSLKLDEQQHNVTSAGKQFQIADAATYKNECLAS